MLESFSEYSLTLPTKIMSDAKEPEKDLKKLEEEQAKEDAALLANLEKESKEFDKVSPRQLRFSYT